MKIPFVRDSELNRSGQLQKIISEQPNKQKINYNWKDMYNQKNADIVYYNNSYYFDLFGYDKNSWKKI